MTFPYPPNPENWQTAYTRDRAHRESDARGGMFLLPLGAAFIVAIFFATLLILRLLISGKYTSMVWGVLTLGILLAVLVIFVIIMVFPTRFTSEFFSEFYRPPESINPSRIINYRLYGKTKLPEFLSMLSRFEYILAQDGQLMKNDGLPAWMARTIGGPILLIVFDGCALYLERGNRFSRVVGPGSPFLEWHETIKYVVDLRPKTKIDSFNVWTKDGINIKLTVRIQCRIGDPAKHDPQASGLVYPFDPVAVKKAIERIALRWPNPLEEPSEFTWDDAAWGQVTGVIPSFVGRRMLDDLLMADRNSGQILSPEAVSQIQADINKNTNGFGVYVTELQIISMELPKEVIVQQEEFWKAEKEGLATIIDGQAKAFNIRTREKARADAQRDIILAIADGLDKNQNGQFSEPLLLSLSSILDESLKDPLTRAYLAKETLETLEMLQKTLDKPSV